MEKKRIVFILGIPRSGTTLVYGMLVRNQSCIGGSFKESQFYSHILLKPWALETFLSDPYFTDLLSAEEIREVFLRSDSHLSFFRNAIDRFLEREGKCIFVEKSPPHTLFFRRIIEDFQRPTILLVERNPAAVVNSIVRTRWSILASDRLPGKLKDVVWLKYVAAILKYYRYARALEEIRRYPHTISVRYEDIVTGAIDLRVLLEEELGVPVDPLYVSRPFSPDVQERNYTLDKRRIEGYRQTMPPSMQRLVALLFSPNGRLQTFSSRLLRVFLLEPVCRLKAAIGP